MAHCSATLDLQDDDMVELSLADDDKLNPLDLQREAEKQPPLHKYRN